MTPWEAHLAAHAMIAGTGSTTRYPDNPSARAASDALARGRAELGSLAQAVVAQEASVWRAAEAVRAPVTLSDPERGPVAPFLPWEEATADLRAKLGAAHEATGELYRLGNRAPLFPGPGQTARTVLIFLLCSIPMVALNMIAVIYVFGDLVAQSQAGEPQANWNGALLLCSGLVLPVLTAAAGALTTFTVGRPRITTTANLVPGMAIGILLCFVLSIGSLCLSQPLALL